MKARALISCAVTVQLICAFVFGYAKTWFSHYAAHISINLQERIHIYIISRRNKVRI